MVAGEVAVAVRSEHEQRGLSRFGEHVAEQCERGAVRPMEIVEHEHNRRFSTHLLEQPHHSREEQVTLGLGISAARRRQRPAPDG